jgi:2-C-methyl-D-erythritol 4-phosphate cytidylyltransferase
MVFNKNHVIWAIVPAAGIGKRMQSDIPKQYLPLNGRPVIEHTINALLNNENISGLVIALAPEDAYFADIKISSEKPVIRTNGGNERADSVLNALNALFQHEQYGESDWVMVHDAVRPCLCQQDIDQLVAEVADNKNGGLLALPVRVRDTMKRQKPGNRMATVAQTVEREYLWHALTPQYFPALSLKNAIEKALSSGQLLTDESSAMELAGFAPRLVHGHEDNIKITRPYDLFLASLYLQARIDNKR